MSQLFEDALALSAWKQAGRARWPLRVNPSSGNLHPTEGYLVAGPVTGVHPLTAIYHYAPLEHGLELRAELPSDLWHTIVSGLSEQTVLVGLTSIWWRESWKYGERGFRYCQHDVGHAIGSVAVAAAALGWPVRVLENVSDAAIATLLGLDGQTGVEAEHAECLIAVCTSGRQPSLDAQRAFTLPETALDQLRDIGWSGVPNRLSSAHHAWPVIDDVATATEKASPPDSTTGGNVPRRRTGDHGQLSASIAPAHPAAPQCSGTRWPHRHLERDLLSPVGERHAWRGGHPVWRGAMAPICRPVGLSAPRGGVGARLVPPHPRPLAPTQTRSSNQPEVCVGHARRLPYLVAVLSPRGGGCAGVAQETSCDQAIAADGVLAVAMLAEYRPFLEAFGPWFYRRLHWESGLIGQKLYLEAEANGLRGTGIGCFFDELSQEVLGLSGQTFQVLYHFTIGGAVEDPRVQTEPPYDHLDHGRHRGRLPSSSADA